MSVSVQHALTMEGRAAIRRRICSTASLCGVRLSSGTVEDLEQEVFLRLWQSEVVGVMEASPPYVRKVAERTVFDTIRRWRTQKRTARPEAWADLRRLCGKRIPTPEELFLIREEFGILVGWCRMQMSARLFHIFSLVHLKGASRQEVGHLVGLSRDGVDNALYKARRVLKERYERRSLSKVNPSEGK